MQNYISDPDVISLANEIMEGKCMVFLGAGASVNAGFPSWAELEKKMKNKAPLKYEYGPYRTADIIKEAIGENEFFTFLENIFKRNIKYTELHKRLAELPINVFITTNYDLLIEEAIRDERGKENIEVLINNNALKWRTTTFDKNDNIVRVLKIHGCVTQFPDDIIIGEQDYLSYKESNSHVIACLTSLLERRSVLFIGYSLSDWNITQILFNVIGKTAGNSHNRYFVGINNETSLIKYFSKKFGLRIINIEADSREQIEDELLELLSQVTARFKIPIWLIESLRELNQDIKIDTSSLNAPLSKLLSGFDSTIFIRLALKIEKRLKIIIPLEKMIDPNLTVEDLINMVKQKTT